MLNKHLYVIRSLSWGKKFTIQQYEARCHTANSVTNYFNDNVPDYVRKENWPPNSCDLNLLDYTIWDIMKKILYKNLKRYQDIEGLLAVYAWDRPTKNFINNPISGRRRRWSHCTSNLTALSHDSTYISIDTDMLFINRTLNMIKWL